MASNDRLNSTLSIKSQIAVTPSDTANLSFGDARGLYVGVSGNVAVILSDDQSAVTLVGLAGGVWHPMAVKRVLATGTTATSIVAGQ